LPPPGARPAAGEESDAGRALPEIASTVRLDGTRRTGLVDRLFVSDFSKIPNEGPFDARDRRWGFHDEEALYVGARMMTDAGRHMAIVSRRQRGELGTPDRLPRHVPRSPHGLQLRRHLLGVRIDYYHPRDAEMDRDYSYDPVWEARTKTCEDGWTAEMRIPFSQLRFDRRDEQVWGLNLNRWIPDRNEDSYWVCVPAKETGWASRFGELRGIRGIRPSRRIEFLPYAAGDARFTGDIGGRSVLGGANGIRARRGRSQDGARTELDLEGTVNPDFGQVEADPAVVNLSARDVLR
jgi:hypothetical protein